MSPRKTRTQKRISHTQCVFKYGGRKPKQKHLIDIVKTLKNLTGSFLLWSHTISTHCKPLTWPFKKQFQSTLRNCEPWHGIIQILYLTPIAFHTSSLTIYWSLVMWYLSSCLSRNHFFSGISLSFCLMTTMSNSLPGSKPLKRPIWSAKCFNSHSSHPTLGPSWSLLLWDPRGMAQHTTCRRQ